MEIARSGRKSLLMFVLEEGRIRLVSKRNKKTPGTNK